MRPDDRDTAEFRTGDQTLPRRRSRQILYAMACTLLILVIIGLLIATWMPAIYQRLHKDSSPSASQPAPTSRQS